MAHDNRPFHFAANTMPPRNLNVILITVCVATLCYFTHRRARTAMMVGDALELINNYYVDPVDDEQLLIAAMNGMTSELDENSEYIPIQDYESFQDSINQEFAGIGIFVEQSEAGSPVRVVTPLVGSPALKAGVRPGDLIIRVDDVDVSSMDLPEVSKRLKGPINTLVNLLVRRDDGEFALSVTRDTIPLPSVIGDHRGENDRWVYRLADDPTIAYVRLTSFGEKTVAETAQVLVDLDNEFRGLVLDLRGNGGGLLQAAADISDMFIDRGKIVSTRIRGGKAEDEFNARPGTLVDHGKPIAVLINGNSASASEIVAACLQDHGRAAVVGTRSYGKGTVQNILPLQYGRSALRLTVARYYRPNGENIHRSKDATEEDQWGVSPDEGMAIELNEETIERLAQRWQEASYPAMAASPSGAESDGPDGQPEQDPGQPVPDSGLSLDPQLKRAVEYLREKIESATVIRDAA
jgi:carboxyl-terminal processing protease